MTFDQDTRLWLEARTRAAGFDTSGIAPIDATEDARFADWINNGYAADMEWLKRSDDTGNLVRGDLRRSIPWARSVIVCAVNYNTRPIRSIDPAAPTQGWIARYAWSGQTSITMDEDRDAPMKGADYHDVLLEKLRTVERDLHEKFPAVETRCYVDTGPLLERGLAAKAGVGWIGRNTCVLNQGLGSWLLLACIVTSLEIAPEATIAPAADRCGSCTRCIDACPTDALLLGEPRQMDASRCIAYLTIEKKGEIDPALRDGIGRQVFGCDICQDVCPWNRKAPVSESAFPIREKLINPDLEWLAQLDGREFNRWFRGSPLERTGRKRVLRNVATAMGNSLDQTFAQTLKNWQFAPDPVLSDAASWALRKLGLPPEPPEDPAL